MRPVQTILNCVIALSARCAPPFRVSTAIFLVALVSRSAEAQVRPLRDCSPLNQPIRVLVGSELAPSPSPKNEAASIDSPSGPTEVTLLLLAPASDGKSADTLIESRPVPAGEVDLARVFQRLWKTDDPRVLYVQAAEDESGDKRVGPALVLVPMVTPRYASRTDRTGAPQLNPLPASADGRPSTASTRAFSGYWLFNDQHAVFDLGTGELAFALRADAAPMSIMHARRLVSSGFYDGVAVHRIASLSGQTAPDIVQFGDPTGTGRGGPGFMIDFEPSSLPHTFGTLSLARTSDPNSAGSQLFITLSNDVGSALNDRYTVLGRLVSGAEVLRAIGKSPTTADAAPRDPIVIRSAKLVDAPPRGTPDPKIDETTGANKGPVTR